MVPWKGQRDHENDYETHEKPVKEQKQGSGFVWVHADEYREGDEAVFFDPLTASHGAPVK